MAKIESNIQLPTVILGGLLALIIKDAIQLLFGVATQDYLTELQQKYLADGGKDVPWWIENLQTLYGLALIVTVAIFSFAFYWFVVRDGKKLNFWKRQNSAKTKKEKPASK